MEVKRILINRSNMDPIVIEIPAKARMTFSSFNPGKPGYGEKCLRVYLTQQNQLACIPNVESFRDIDSVKLFTLEGLTMKETLTDEVREAIMLDDGPLPF